MPDTPTPTRRIRLITYRRRGRLDIEAVDEATGLPFSNVSSVRAVPRIGIVLVLDATTPITDTTMQVDLEETA